MPDLPLISMSQAHYDRVVAAFPGVGAAKAQAYVDWSINNLISYVEQVEYDKIDKEYQTQANTKRQQIRDSLPPRRQWPPAGTV
jgi:hypothetical protein